MSKAAIETRMVFAATETFDSEGGSQRLRLFLRSDVADAFAAKHAFMGRARVDPTEKRLVRIGDEVYVLGERVYETLDDVADQQRLELRRAALAKLTAEERAALGIS